MSTDNALHLVEALLIQRFIDNIGTLNPAIPLTRVKFPNAQFTTPNNLSWIRINSPINNGPIEQDASGCYEINSGFLVISTFFPKGSGSQNAMKVAHQIKALYTAKILGDVAVISVIVSPTPEPESSPWYGCNTQINFQFEGYTS